MAWEWRFCLRRCGESFVKGWIRFIRIWVLIFVVSNPDTPGWRSAGGEHLWSQCVLNRWACWIGGRAGDTNHSDLQSKLVHEKRNGGKEGKQMTSVSHFSWKTNWNRQSSGRKWCENGKSWVFQFSILNDEYKLPPPAGTESYFQSASWPSQQSLLFDPIHGWRKATQQSAFFAATSLMAVGCVLGFCCTHQKSCCHLRAKKYSKLHDKMTSFLVTSSSTTWWIPSCSEARWDM